MPKLFLALSESDVSKLGAFTKKNNLSSFDEGISLLLRREFVPKTVMLQDNPDCDELWFYCTKCRGMWKPLVCPICAHSHPKPKEGFPYMETVGVHG